MATDIVQSLFGVTPESYQQRQSDLADARALQFARLSPFEKASFGISRGVGQLAGALGGQDPELQMISARQQIAKQINPNDPNSVQQGIVALQQAGDTQGAMMLQAEYRKMQESGALVSQREAAGLASLAQARREKAPPTTDAITNARAIAARAGVEGSPEYSDAFNAALDRLTTKEAKGPGFGTDREAVAAEVYGKIFGDLTQAEKAAVNKRVEEEGGRKAASGAARLILPGAKELVDIPAFRAKVQSTIDPQAKAINAADQALEAIENSLATDNFASYRAAQTQFARAISGAGDLSQRELKAAGADPSLLGGTADYISSLFTSTPTIDTQKKIKQTLEAIRKVAANKASAEVAQQRNIALRSPGYDRAAVEAALNFPELAPRVAAPALGSKALPPADQMLLDKYTPKAK
jgi:hypothetical protein